MKKLYTILTSLFFLTSFFYSQEVVIIKGEEAQNKIPNSELIRLKSYTNFPNYIKFNQNANHTINNLETWIQQTTSNLNIGINLLNSQTDDLGFTHYRYQQTYKGYPIEHTMIIAHEKNGKIVSINGDLLTKNLPSSFNQSISFEQAIQKAKQAIGAEQYKWEVPGEEAFIKKEQNDLTATFAPQKELVFISKNGKLGEQLIPVYKLNIYAHKPISRTMVYVNAINGKIEFKENLLHHADTPGTATTVYSGSRAIVADSYGGQYRLREAGRGNGIETYNMLHGGSYAGAVDFLDLDNIWNNVNAQMDEYAGDAHWGTEMVYDYYNTVHGRNSIDGLGLKLLSYVNADLPSIPGLSLPDNANAFWDGTRMTYGLGEPGNTVLSKPLTTIDITGHEITHGLIEFSANLDYSYESGALNESFADIFAVAIDYWARPALANWVMGEECSNSGVDYIRNLSDPNDKNHPDTYLGNFWYAGAGDNGGVHTNSGVQNHWFYLLSVGGSGTNDNSDVYAVNGIGIDKAAKIAFRNLTVYLVNTSQYADARFYAIQSARDLYGDCSIEVYATTEAWYAVGVGTPYTGAAFLQKNGGWCLNNITIQDIINVAGNWQWYKDGVLLPGETNPIINVSTGGYGAGVYTLIYTDAGGIVCDIQSMEVIQPNNPIANFDYVSTCEEKIMAFNDLSDPNGDSIISWSWDFGDGNVSNDTNPVNVYAANGNYNVSLTVTNSEGCTHTFNLNVPVNSPSPLNLRNCNCDGQVVASLIPNHSFEDRNCCPSSFSQMTCADNWIQASNATSDYHNTCNYVAPCVPLPISDGNGCVGTHIVKMGSGNYLEYVGACLSSPMVSGTQYKLKIDIAAKYVDGWLNVSAPGAPPHINLAIFGTPNCADLPFTGSNCPIGSGGWIQIGTISYDPTTTWSTVQVSITPGININAVAIGGPCNLPIGYQMTNTPNGSFCYFMWDNIRLKENSIQIADSGHYCKGNLELSAIPDTIKGPSYYRWFKDSIELVGENDSILKVSQNGYGVGAYQVMYIYRDECMITEFIVDSGNISFDSLTSPTCPNAFDGRIEITNVSGGTNPYQYKMEGGLYQNSNIFNNVSHGVHLVTVIDSNMCKFTDTVIVDSLPLPTPDFDALAVCLNELTYFINQSVMPGGAIVSYNWDFGNGNTSQLKDPSNKFTPDGFHNVQLAVVASNGCKDTIIKPIEIYPLPNADFAFFQELGTIFNTKTCFQNTSSGAISYLWDFNFNNQTSNGTNPCINFPNDKPGEYNVMLVATSDKGCTDTTYQIVYINDETLIHIPNTFTPNGDNLNETFKPIFSSISSVTEYDFMIFDRWGELVFSTSDFNAEWDGTFRAEKCKTDTYVWRLKVKAEYDSGTFKTIEKMGHINLLR